MTDTKSGFAPSQMQRQEQEKHTAYPQPYIDMKATLPVILLILRVHHHKPEEWQWNFLFSTPAYTSARSDIRERVASGQNSTRSGKVNVKKLDHAFPHLYEGEHQCCCAC